MWINSYKELSLSYHYHTLQAEQKAQISKMASSLGVSIQELSFYFENIKASLGNIDFFAFVFFIYKRPQILNNLRMINLNMNMSNWGTSYKVSGGGSYGSTPVSSVPGSGGSSSSSSSRALGDAFLTAFSPQELAQLKDGQKIDLKNGVINSIDSLKQFDKNNDGKLTGDELKDLQIAVDKNKDGKIEQGELAKALEAGVKEIDLNNKTLTTNDGKQMGLNEGMVNVGTNGQNNNTNAVTVDVDRTGNQSKDNNNRLEPASSPNLGSSDSSSSSNASNTSNTSNASSSGAGER